MWILNICTRNSKCLFWLSNDKGSTTSYRQGGRGVGPSAPKQGYILMLAKKMEIYSRFCCHFISKRLFQALKFKTEIYFLIGEVPRIPLFLDPPPHSIQSFLPETMIVHHVWHLTPFSTAGPVISPAACRYLATKIKKKQKIILLTAASICLKLLIILYWFS